MKLLLLLVIGLCATSALGQGVQCDPFTGSLNGSIPLMSVTSGDISVPVGISYHTNGVKVNSSAGTAGVGWNLFAGGSVTRELRGLPDDHINDNVYGWLHGSVGKNANNFTPTADPNNDDCTDENYDFDILNAFGYTNDTEPDIFTFTAPGLSGSFVFDKTKVWRPVPYQDIDIAITRRAIDSLITKIIITNNTGVKYTFSQGQLITRKADNPGGATLSLFTTKYYQYEDPRTYYATWDLTKIESPTGGIITLTYAIADDSESAQHYRQVDEAASPPVVDTIYTVTDNISSKQLSTITGTNVVATFTWSGSVIGSILFQEQSYNTSKKYSFKYGFVRYSGVPNSLWNPPIKLPFLLGVTQEADCSFLPGYNFEYHGVDQDANTTDMPFGTDKGQDLFGYYNQNGTSQIPDLWTKSGDTGTNGERYRYYSGYPGAGTSYTETLTGGSRGIAQDKVYYGALAKFSLPSGGSTYITYERTDYYDPTSQDREYGPGVRVKKMATYSEDTDTMPFLQYYSYLTTSSASSGVMPYRPMYALADGAGVVRSPDNLAPDESVFYTRVEVSATGQGRIVYEFNAPGIYPETSSGVDFAASMTRVVRDATQCNSGTLGNFKRGQYYTYPFAPNVNYDFERGLPSTIIYYTRDNKIASSKTYAYQRSTLPKYEISGIHFEKTGPRAVYSKYKILSNLNKYTSTETSRVYDQTDGTNNKYVETITTYTYSGKQLLSAITTTDSDETAITQTFKYAKDYDDTGTDTQSLMINALVAANRGGTIVETTTKRGGNYTGAALTLFDNTFGASRVLPKQILALGDPGGFTESIVDGTQFKSAVNYYPATSIDAYDDLGNATITRDKARATSSFISGHNRTLPAIEISNARNDQVVFADFEPNTAMLPVFPDTKNSSDVFAGKYSLNLANGSSLTKSGVGKGKGKFYRFTCWVKASSAATLNISINSGTAIGASYTNTNKWQFVEKRIDMTSVGSTFSFSVTPSVNVIIDNLVFLPEIATYLTHSYEPLNGKTSDIDSRGNGAFQEYDGVGRPARLSNQNREIVRVTDYHNRVDPSPPSSQISGPTAPDMTVSATYSVDVGCSGAVTYQWTVDDASVGTGSTLSYAFTINKDYQVRVTVVSSYGTTHSEMTVHPKPTFHASLSGGGTPSFTCTDSEERHITLVLDGCYDVVTYAWYLNGSLTGNFTDHYDFFPAGGSNIEIYCVVKAKCYNHTTGTYTTITSTTGTKRYTYVNTGGPC